MATTHLGGSPVRLGELPQVGQNSPNFKLVKNDLSHLDQDALKGKRTVLNIFPSVDTGVCATSIRKFNEIASKLENTEVLCVSADLPFAQKRFCGAEGIENVTSLSGFRTDFGDAFGVKLQDSAFAGLYARAIVVLDEDNKVVHSQLVNEVGEEPDYDVAIASLG